MRRPELIEDKLGLGGNREPIVSRAVVWTIGVPAVTFIADIHKSHGQVYGKAPIHFQDEVRRGEKFEKEIGNNLVFRLAPDEFGWNIEVRPVGSEDDFTDCVNTPVHGTTARLVRGWHFPTDDNSTDRKPSDYLTIGI